MLGSDRRRGDPRSPRWGARVHDLAALWKRQTGLPFVFAVWLVRPNVGITAAHASALRAARDRGVARAASLAREAARALELPEELLRSYLTDACRYDLDAPGMREGARGISIGAPQRSASPIRGSSPRRSERQRFLVMGIANRDSSPMPPEQNSRSSGTATMAKSSKPTSSSAQPPADGRPARVARVTAEQLATQQREISVAEFFTKNRHLLGFDNPRKALLTTVKEAVDNSLDACEEAGILPTIRVRIDVVAARDGTMPTLKDADRFVVTVTDNGPGIVKEQIPRIFAKLLYGSKFHRLRQARGQQGIGISAAGMYGQLTTGKPVRVISRTSPNKAAHRFAIQINTQKNEPIKLRGGDDR